MPNFPIGIDDNESLFLVVNNLRTQLTSSIDASTLTIPVVTTSGFPPTGFISILTGSDITLTEAIKYGSLAPTQFNATQRGADGTQASTHGSSTNVDFTIVASHHNEIKDAILELEQFVGASGSENFLGVDSSGNVTITGTTTVAGITATSGAFSQSLTISGVPVSTGTLTIKETDGSPIVTNVNTIVVTTGTLTDDGGGQVTISTGGGAGGGAGALDEGKVALISQVFGI